MPNPYPGQFEYLCPMIAGKCRALGREPVILDLGSGGRKRDDVISMEWVEHPDNSLRGDCLNLPFGDNVADLILSQAVLEHVTDPMAAVNEMRRVLKPGGIAYVEVAFIQPVHQAPIHYFNVTPHGMAWLFRDWETLETGTVGTMQETIGWLMRAVGFREPRLQREPAKHLYELAASGVSITARKLPSPLDLDDEVDGGRSSVNPDTALGDPSQD